MGSILRRVVSLGRLALVLVWTFGLTAVALLVYLFTRRHDLPLAMARRLWAPGVLSLMGARLEVHHPGRLDRNQPYLFVANHTSQLDIPVLFAALPIPLRFLAKEELRRMPLVGAFMAAMGMVFIDRHDSEAARRSIETLAESLAGGNGLMAFPEGTRSPDGRLQPFKTGAFVAAIKAAVPVVPLYIRGASAVLPARSLLIRPGRVSVTVGEPLATAGMTVDDRRRLADATWSQMRELESTEP